AVRLWVCQRASPPGSNMPKSGTMLPMTAAVKTCQRVSHRYAGRTAATCETVKGILRATGSAAPLARDGSRIRPSRPLAQRTLHRADVDETETALLGEHAQLRTNLAVIPVAAGEPDGPVALRVEGIE